MRDKFWKEIEKGKQGKEKQKKQEKGRQKSKNR